MIYNAFAISIGERKKQFGMFASVGATAAQIRRIVLTEAGVIAAIGIPLGILGAIAGVGILLKLTQGIVSQLILDAEQGMPLVVSPLVIGLTCCSPRRPSCSPPGSPPGAPPGFAHRCHPPERRDPGGQAAQPAHQPADPACVRVRGRAGAQIPQRDRKRYLTTLLSLMISIILFVAFNALMLYTNTTQRMAVKR